MTRLTYSLEQELATLRAGDYGDYRSSLSDSARPSPDEYRGFGEEGRAFERAAARERRERQLDDGPGEQEEL